MVYWWDLVLPQTEEPIVAMLEFAVIIEMELVLRDSSSICSIFTIGGVALGKGIDFGGLELWFLLVLEALVFLEALEELVLFLEFLDFFLELFLIDLEIASILSFSISSSNS